VPTPEEHRRRAVSRHRHHLVKEVKRLASTGLSLLYDHGFLEVSRRWWGPRNWPKLRAQLQSNESSSWLVEILQPLQETILRFDRRQQELAEAVIEANLGDPEQRQGLAPTPKGFGELTRAEARAEVADWNRFNNRKQVGSLGGLCPSEHSSGPNRVQGPIDRMGNPRLRGIFVEAAWRMVRWQPDYRGVRKFAHVLAKGAKATKAARKKAVVGLARMLMVDMWRIETGRCSPAQLGLN
jgi:transposase